DRHGHRSAHKFGDCAGGYMARATLLSTSMVFLLAGHATADQVAVRYPEGRTHGFLVLRDLQNNILASGDWSQSVKGERVTAELVFNFKDGSIHQETTVFSQRGTFAVLTYHLVQKGPSFKHAGDMSLNVANGQIIVRSTDEHGKETTITEKIKV